MQALPHAFPACGLALCLACAALAAPAAGKDWRAELAARQRRHGAVQGARYLDRALRDDGTYHYDFLVARGQAVDDYNWVRHAASLLALCQLHQVTGDDQLLVTARRAADRLVKQCSEREVAGQKMLCLIELSPWPINEARGMEVAKLGGHALAIAGFLALDEALGEETYAPAARRLAAFLHTCVPEGAAPHCVYLFNAQRFSDFELDYYPGEALLALAALERHQPAPANRRSMHRLLRQVSARWAEQLRRKQRERLFDHWGLIGLEACLPLLQDGDEKSIGRSRAELLELAVAVAEPEFALMVADGPLHLRGAFRPGGPGDDEAGGFGTTATRLEGLLAVWRAWRDLSDQELRERLAPRVQDWPERLAPSYEFIRFCQNQARDVGAYDLPIDITGSFRSGYGKTGDHARVRFDNTVHAISALIGPELKGPPRAP